MNIFGVHADGVIGIGITATAVGIIAGGIAAALARKKWWTEIVHLCIVDILEIWPPSILQIFPKKCFE